MVTARVIRGQEFVARIEPIMADLFTYENNRRRPFANTNWRTAPLPGEFTYLQRDIIDAAIYAASKFNGETAIVAAIEALSDDASDLVAQVSKSRLGTLDFDGSGLICSFDYAIFDESKRWAIVSYNDFYSLIGGDHDFMELFMSKVDGGAEEIKRRFIGYIGNSRGDIARMWLEVLTTVGWQDAWQPKDGGV